MVTRKKRIVLITVSIALAIILIAGIMVFLYLKTDAFKTNETLFAKYLVQNLETMDNLKASNATEITTTLDNNKYTSDLNGKLDYVENISTSDENKDNEINRVSLNISSKTDKLNNYYYKDIKILKEDDKLMRAEYLNSNDIFGIRLDGIKQFVSVQDKDLDDLSEKTNIKNLQGIFEKIDFNSLIKLTDEEKETLKTTYLNVIRSNISKERYAKQSNAVITVNNQDVQTNAYYLKMTFEEYNNLCIKILEQLTKDQIILSKIDNIETEIRKRYDIDKEEGYIKQEFINYINEKIEEIQNNNIGQEEVKITVYENKMKTVRTMIEKTKNKLTLDLYNNNNGIKISDLTLGDKETENVLKFEKQGTSNEDNILITYEKNSNNELERSIKIKFVQNMNNNNISKNVQLEIANQKYKATFDVEDTIEIVNEFDEQITVDEDNIILNDTEKEKVDTILQILIQNVSDQINTLNSKVSLNEYIKMFRNLQVIDQEAINISDEPTVTETEKNRFNSQFEFFESENLDSDNIKELVGVCKENFEDMKIIFDGGMTGDLDLEKLNSSDYTESRTYQESIKGMKIYIKQKTANDQKQEDLLKLIEILKNEKYNVTLDYNSDTGLVESIEIKIAEED